MTDLIETAVAQLGIEATSIKTKRNGHQELWALCPGHESVTGRPDRKPSWSISLATGVHSCFSCGYGGNLFELIEFLTGELPEDLLSELRLASMERMVERAGERVVRVEGQAVVPLPEPEKHVSEWAYNQFSELPRRMCKVRNLDPYQAWIYGLRWDQASRVWIIPVRNNDGQLLGWQERAVGYFRNRPAGVAKSECLFGLSRYEGSKAILVESPLDAVRLASCGYTGALSSYGVHYSDVQMETVVEVADTLVVALDNDGAGRALATRLRKEYGQRLRLLFLSYRSTAAKDVGDMTDDEISSALAQASAVPHR